MSNSLIMFTDTLHSIINIVRLHYYKLLYFFEKLNIYVYNDFTLCLLVLISVSPCHNIL